MSEYSFIIEIEETEMPRGKSLSEEQVESRQRQILEAAARCFSIHGYHATTIKDIAREAGLAEGTLYLYFENKRDLLLHFLRRVVSESAAAIFREGEEKSPREVLTAFVESRLRIHARNANLMKVVFGEALFDKEMAKSLSRNVFSPTVRALTRYLESCRKRGTLKVNQPALAAQTLMAMMLGHALVWGEIACEEPPRISPGKRAEFIRDFFLNGAATTGKERNDVRQKAHR